MARMSKCTAGITGRFQAVITQHQKTATRAGYTISVLLESSSSTLINLNFDLSWSCVCIHVCIHVCMVCRGGCRAVRRWGIEDNEPEATPLLSHNLYDTVTISTCSVQNTFWQLDYRASSLK